MENNFEQQKTTYNTQNGAPIAYQTQPQPQPQPQSQPVNAAMPTPVRPRYKSKFLTFCCALIPGAGQMYHGLLKKGVSIMILFWGTIAISALLYLLPINFVLPVIWFYSFFEAVNRMGMPIDEMRLIEDKSIFVMPKTDNTVFNSIFAKRHLVIGWAVFICGLYSFLYFFAERILFNFDFFCRDEIAWVITSLPGIIVPIVCIVLGVKLIASTKPKSSVQSESDKNITD